MTSIIHIRRILGGNRCGAVAVEFALVLLPFFVTLIGLIGIATYQAKSGVLQHAVEIASRMIKTGQVTTLTGFTKSITDNSYGLLDVSALSINVTAYESFAQVPSTLSALFDSGGKPTNQNFQPGTGNKAVVVRVGSRFTIISATTTDPETVSPAASTTDLILTITSTTAFRNEPF